MIEARVSPHLEVARGLLKTQQASTARFREPRYLRFRSVPVT
jgi:hypothetical protein